MHDGIEVEATHQHPENTKCDCCQGQMIEIGSTLVREEAEFIPARMKKVQHIEQAYECKKCKGDSFQKAQVKRGKATEPPILRSIASPSVLAKVIYDKFTTIFSTLPSGKGMGSLRSKYQ